MLLLLSVSPTNCQLQEGRGHACLAHTVSLVPSLARIIGDVSNEWRDEALGSCPSLAAPVSPLPLALPLAGPDPGPFTGPLNWAPVTFWRSCFTLDTLGG